MVNWVILRTSFENPVSPGSPPQGFTSFIISRFSLTSLQTLPKNLYDPSTPSMFQSRSRSGGAAKSEKRRVVSAPYLSIMPSGAIVFFFVLLIFSTAPIVTSLPHSLHFSPLTSSSERYPCSAHFMHALQTIPCVKRFSNGSAIKRSPKSLMAFVKNLE